MYILLIVFFISLAGVIFLIGRKLIQLRNGKVLSTSEFLFAIPSLEKVKEISTRGTKKIGYTVLVNTIKFSIKSSNSLKSVHQKIKNKTKNIKAKYIKTPQIEMKEKRVSKFLKMISQYKHKIRKIKSKIKEEEGIE